MIKLWSNFSLHSDTLSTFASSFVRTMSMLRSRKTALDPFQFFCCLKNVVNKSGKCDFNLLRQHDTNEIMSCIYEKLCSESSQAQDMRITTLKNLFFATTQYSICQWQFFYNHQRTNWTRLVFCNFCENYELASIDHQISQVGKYSIFQRKCFVNYRGGFIKDIIKAQCTKTLSVPLVYEVAFHKNFNLIVTFNHTGTHNRGHCTNFVKQPNSSSWFLHLYL